MNRETYNVDNQIRFKTSMIRSCLYDYSDSYILVKGTIAVAQATAAAPDNANKKVIFKNCAPFTNFTSRINNTQIDDGHDIVVIMSMYNLIEYSNSYSKTSGIFWQYYRDEPALADDNTITDFNKNDATTNSFTIKEKITGQTGNDATKNVEISKKYQSRT